MAWSISWLQVTEVTDHVHCRDRSRGGHGKARDEWFPLTQAVVVYDHARHAPLADVITLDFINAGLEPGVPAGIELTLETAKELLAALERAITAAELEEAKVRARATRRASFGQREASLRTPYFPPIKRASGGRSRS